VYSDSALQCITATNAFYAVDDFCTNNYRELYQASSVASITNAAVQACISGNCIQRSLSFSEYLSACRDLEAGEDDSVIYIVLSNCSLWQYCFLFVQFVGENLGFLSTLLEHTSCSTNGSASCAAVILFSSTLPTIYSAFVSLRLHFMQHFIYTGINFWTTCIVH